MADDIAKFRVANWRHFNWLFGGHGWCQCEQLLSKWIVHDEASFCNGKKQNNRNFDVNF
jgi:hypothetical protein